MTLYTINRELLELFSQIEAQDGELTPEQEEQLSTLELSRDEKIRNCVWYIRNERAKLAAIETELKRFQELKKSKANHIERIEEQLSTFLSVQGISKFDNGTEKVSFRKSEQVNIVDAALIPESFRKEKIEISYDKNAIKAAIKSGEKIEGVEIVINDNIQIK